MTTGQANKKSRLQMQIRKYVKILVIVAGTWGAGCFIIGGFVHNWKNPVNLLSQAFLTIAIAIVPCGLPATVTSSLTLVAQRLVKKNVYLKKLDIVEALGSANIIASDKTGTLTKNVMTVTDIWYHDKFIPGKNFINFFIIGERKQKGHWLFFAEDPKKLSYFFKLCL